MQGKLCMECIGEIEKNEINSHEKASFFYLAKFKNVFCCCCCFQENVFFGKMFFKVGGEKKANDADDRINMANVH